MSTVNNEYFDAPDLQPVLTPKGAFCFRLTKPWPVKLNDDEYLIIPEGSLSNFATVPWFFRWIIQSSDPVIALPAIIHDYLVAEWIYEGEVRKPPVKYDNDGNEHPMYNTADGFNYAESAYLFRKYALSFQGNIAHIKARVCYVMLRLFGYYRDLLK